VEFQHHKGIPRIVLPNSVTATLLARVRGISGVEAALDDAVVGW
jgi:hypothetical protein